MNDFKFRKKLVESLSDLLSSGIGLVESIEIISKSFNKKEKYSINCLKKDIEKGKDLEKSFRHISKDKEFLLFIKTAEKTGNISSSLKLLKEKYTFKENVQKEIATILIYPLFLIIFSIIIFILLLIYVVPKFIEIYSDISQELPTITLFIISLSNIIRQYYIIIILILSLPIISIIIIKKLYKNIYDAILIKYIAIYREYVILSFTQNMYIILANKIDFLQSLKICMNTENSYFKKELYKLYKNIEKGEYVSRAFSKCEIFDEEYKNYIRIADSTAKLDESFKNLSIILDSRLKSKIRIYFKLLEPLFIIIIASMIGFIVLSIMLPIFTLGENY